MNPITITATKLENEAQTLYNALQQHSSLCPPVASVKPPGGATSAAPASPIKSEGSN